MRQFECVADKKIYTESQLRQLFQLKLFMDMIINLRIGSMKNFRMVI